MKYNMTIGENTEKKPTEPSVQTAVKTDVQEALEILLEGEGKKSLTANARAFRKRMDELEERK